MCTLHTSELTETHTHSCAWTAFLCIGVTWQWSRLATVIENSMCEFLKAEKQKKQTLQPQMAQILITVTVTDHHCWGMQKRKLRAELAAAFKATHGLVMQSVESFSTEILRAWETNRSREGRRMHWLVTTSLEGPQNENFHLCLLIN